MVRVTLTGSAGRMGKTLVQVISQDKETSLTGAVEIPGSPFLGMDAGELAGVGKAQVKIMDNLKEAVQNSDVIIDFSFLEAVEANVNTAAAAGKALVIGTTGLSKKQIELIEDAGKTIPVIWAPNYSIGVNLIASLTRIAAQVLSEGFDPEIVEAHHNLKKDSPSGTAVKLLNVLKDVYQTNDVVYGREGMVGQRPAKQIGVHAVRGGDVVGDHTVTFYGIGERVEIVHKASSRETFARGAVRAAKYIVSHGKGLYSIEEILGLK